VDYVYIWVDGIHVNIAWTSTKLCLLVVIGVRADGSKELVALARYRESPSRGRSVAGRENAAACAPRYSPSATGHSVSGALREVYPTRASTLLVHKSAKLSCCATEIRAPGGRGGRLGRRDALGHSGDGA